MEKVADTGALEIWRALTEKGQDHFIMHGKLSLDARAGLVVEMVKAWGAMQLFSGAIADLHDQPHKRAGRPTIESLVFTAVDTVDTLFEELSRRGWVAKVPGLRAIEGEQNNVG